VPYPVQFGSGEWTTVVTRCVGTLTREMTSPDGPARWDDELLVEEYVSWDSALQAQQIGLA
jgi:hypothetical protein